MKRPAPPEIAQEGTRRVVGLLCVLCCIACWGAIPVILRELRTDIDSWTANGFRYPMAAVLYWPFLLVAFRNGTLNRQLLADAAIPATLSFLGQNFWAMCPYYLPASAIGFFVRSSLIWSLIAAAVWFPDERKLIRNRWFIVGVVLSAAGCGLLSWPDENLQTGITAKGIVFILTASLFFALYGVSVRACLMRHNPLVGFGVVAQGVALGTFTLMLLLGDYNQVRDLPPRQFQLLIASSLLGIALGHFFLYSAVKRVGAALSSAFQTATPLVTAGLAMLFLDEQMTSLGWLGAVTLLFGGGFLLLTQWQPSRNTVNSVAAPSDR